MVSWSHRRAANLERQLAERDETICRLEARIAELEAENQALRDQLLAAQAEPVLA